MNANSLAFNIKKTNLINVSVWKREDPDVFLNLNNEVIQPVEAASLLGIQITKDWSQNYYISEMRENHVSQVEQRFRGFRLLSLSHINHVPANSILSLQGSQGQLHMRQIRMTQVTSPTRRDAYFSRICSLFNQLHAYNLPPMELHHENQKRPWCLQKWVKKQTLLEDEWQTINSRVRVPTSGNKLVVSKNHDQKLAGASYMNVIYTIRQ